MSSCPKSALSGRPGSRLHVRLRYIGMRAKTGSKPEQSSAFGTVLGARKQSLSEQRQRLVTARERLETAFGDLESADTRIAGQKDKISKIRQDFVDWRENSPEPISHLERARVMLSKQERDLTAQLYEIQGKDPISAKNSMDFVDIRTLISALHSEIVTRENEVLELELHVMEHLKNLKNVREQKADLETRRSSALAEKTRLVRHISSGVMNNEAMSQEKVLLGVKLKEAMESWERLARTDLELETEAIEVHRKLKECEEVKTRLDELQRSRIAAAIEQRDELQSRQKEQRLRDRDPQNIKKLDEFYAEEIEIEAEERNIRIEMSRANTEREIATRNYNEARRCLDAALEREESDELELVNIQQEIEKATLENSQLNDELEQKCRALTAMKERVRSQEDVNAKFAAIIQDSRRMFGIETVLQREILAVDEEDKSLDSELERLEALRDSLSVQQAE